MPFRRLHALREAHLPPIPKSGDRDTDKFFGAISSILRDVTRRSYQDIEETEEEIQEVELEVEGIQGNLSSIDLRLISAEDTLTILEGDIEDIEGDITDLQTRVTALENRLDDPETGLDAIWVLLEDLEERVEILEGGP